jgi:hypothetical protein
MTPVMRDPAVFSVSRENPPLDVWASPCPSLSPSRRAPLRRNASRSIVVVPFSVVAAGRAQPALSELGKRERRACVPHEVPLRGLHVQLALPLPRKRGDCLPSAQGGGRRSRPSAGALSPGPGAGGRTSTSPALAGLRDLPWSLPRGWGPAGPTADRMAGHPATRLRRGGGASPPSRPSP